MNSGRSLEFKFSTTLIMDVLVVFLKIYQLFMSWVTPLNFCKKSWTNLLNFYFALPRPWNKLCTSDLAQILELTSSYIEDYA